MKMNIRLTVEEGLKVVAALRDVALARGWQEDELEDSGVIEEYAAVVDAAMQAMGFEFCVDTSLTELAEDAEFEAEKTEVETDEFGVPEDYDSDFDFEEEEEEENPIETMIVERDGKRYLKESDADFLLDTMRKLVYSKTEGLPEVIREKILCDIWCKVGKDNRIDGVLKGE